MKSCSLRFISLATSLLCGCYSMEVANNPALHNSVSANGTGKPIGHVLVTNYGWYLFNCAPLVCGNASPGSAFPWSFFSDQVNPAIVHDRLMEYAASRDANVEELVSSYDEKVFLQVPEVQVPIPYLLCYREVQTSGVLVEREKTPNAKPAEKGSAR